MKRKLIFYVSVGVLIILLLATGIYCCLNSSSDTGQVDVFVGVDAAYDNMESIKSLVDEVKAYTNFFVIGSSGITLDEARLNDTCQYLNDSGLHFAVYMHTTNESDQYQWISNAKQRWSSYFSALYAYDEAGGHQIDYDDPYTLVRAEEASDYLDAADKYVANLAAILAEYQPHDLPLITSDYVLYEYDYRGGYDVVLAEYAWNHSRPLNTALCRGAATIHGKEWGVMITYTYDEWPYLANGTEIYQDMVTAYQNGAKYIVLFDYAKNQDTNVTHGILQGEHLEALEQFWQYAKEHPRTNQPVNERIAYVLPADYGYGFRGPNDSIWGLFPADDQSSKIWNDVNTWVNQNEPAIDVIYEDTLQYGTANYSKLVVWNGTTLTK